MKKYKVHGFYLESRMEGIPDEFPSKIIEAKDESMAIYIYHLMHFPEYENISFKQSFNVLPTTQKTFGISIKEIK